MARQEDVQVAQHYDELGHRRLLAGDFDQAWLYFERALAIRRRTLSAGGIDANRHDILGNLDMLLDEIREQPGSEPYLDRAL